MKNLKGALLFAQSGGPTSVINASACGVFEEAFRHGEITQVLGAAHGVVGILGDELYVEMNARGETHRPGRSQNFPSPSAPPGGRSNPRSGQRLSTCSRLSKDGSGTENRATRDCESRPQS